MNTFRLFVFTAVGGMLLWLLSAAGSVLAPFLLGAVIAYILSPLANKMEAKNIKPALSAALLVLLVFVFLLALPLALIPVIISQLAGIIALLPELVERAGGWLGDAQPYVVEQLQVLDLTDVARQAAGTIEAKDAAGVASAIANFFGKGLAAVVGFFSLLLITPLTAFYFLCDRKIIAGELTDSLPPRWRDKTLLVLQDLDNVLGEFLHGQLLVMLVMGSVYSLVLSIAGLDFAITIGLVSGMLVFLPYVGFIIGLVLATVAAIGQFESWANLVLLWLLMGASTALESFFITPWLVGERIGLHPVFVLLAVLVMGSLLGFVGVLVALPLAAVLLVLSRHLRRYYIESDFYGRNS
ncbi:AI-2E family transporter [Candidatus Persebacteraceae bacterium Df01]|jgi:predicted PurR-regulated permease PerM|uniref:AI-2E family transporter n=1 Tax=Candidatus Doriopsillibacter californiensis TaxID=2970740 RepID=A0ABT7QN68_9GAMM|nr:AI-2E family transporter [Candidatus Persebacteraceae bacterium Df01]